MLCKNIYLCSLDVGDIYLLQTDSKGEFIRIPSGTSECRSLKSSIEGAWRGQEVRFHDPQAISYKNSYGRQIDDVRVPFCLAGDDDETTVGGKSGLVRLSHFVAYRCRGRQPRSFAFGGDCRPQGNFIFSVPYKQVLLFTSVQMVAGILHRGEKYLCRVTGKEYLFPNKNRAVEKGIKASLYTVESGLHVPRARERSLSPTRQ